jgi:subtilisin
MSRPRDRRTKKSATEAGAGTPAGNPPEMDAPEMETTGRYLVLMREDAGAAGVRALQSATGMSITNTANMTEGAVSAETLAGADAVYFDQINIAVVNAPPTRVRTLEAAVADDSNPILAVEPERIMYALETGLGVGQAPMTEDFDTSFETESGTFSDAITQPGAIPLDFLRGYRDAVNDIVGRLIDGKGFAEADVAEGVAPAIDESRLTWGLQLTRASASRFSGRGIRVAVLDTGFDFGHPDYVGRRITQASFIAGETAQDGHGHGTHCTGTACGPQRPGRLPRYGVAFNAEIFIGKVLSNRGSGADGGILNGINWAIRNRCAIISMSLGAPVRPGDTFSPIYEAAARRALAAGTLIIAAAGNESNRPGRIEAVGRPANCPSIMAVGAIDQNLRIAPFSCGGLNPQGGEVNIAGPGVQVYSSLPRPRLNGFFSGTSMATPHVAGIAAQFCEAFPTARGRALWTLLERRARRLTLPVRDVGAGLVQAP